MRGPHLPIGGVTGNSWSLSNHHRMQRHSAQRKADRTTGPLGVDGHPLVPLEAGQADAESPDQLAGAAAGTAKSPAP